MAVHTEDFLHYDDGAVSHLFQVAASLDSMAVGEGQILGQTREALRLGQELGHETRVGDLRVGLDVVPGLEDERALGGPRVRQLQVGLVDREVTGLIETIMDALSSPSHPRRMLESAALGMLTYIENSTDGFRILVRDSPPGTVPGSFASTIQDIAEKVEGKLASEFGSRGYSKKLAPMYANMLVGMVALTGQWWLDVRKPKKDEVVAHVVNLAWNGLSGLEPHPQPTVPFRP